MCGRKQAQLQSVYYLAPYFTQSNLQIVTLLDNRKVSSAYIHRFFKGLECVVQDANFFDCTYILHDRTFLDHIPHGVCFKMVGSNAVVLISVHNALAMFILASSLELNICFCLQSVQN